MTERGISSAQTSRVQALQNKYAILNSRIYEAQKSPSSTDGYVQHLKKQRLVIEEEIRGIHKATSS